MKSRFRFRRRRLGMLLVLCFRGCNTSWSVDTCHSAPLHPSHAVLCSHTPPFTAFMLQPIVSGFRLQDRKRVAVRGADLLISFIFLFVITKKTSLAKRLPYPLFLFETDLPRTAPEYFFFTQTLTESHSIFHLTNVLSSAAI